jgi:hypothetical protein
MENIALTVDLPYIFSEIFKKPITNIRKKTVKINFLV